jgi:hypothetical protein
VTVVPRLSAQRLYDEILCLTDSWSEARCVWKRGVCDLRSKPYPLLSRSGVSRPDAASQLSFQFLAIVMSTDVITIPSIVLSVVRYGMMRTPNQRPSVFVTCRSEKINVRRTSWASRCGRAIRRP